MSFEFENTHGTIKHYIISARSHLSVGSRQASAVCLICPIPSSNVFLLTCRVFSPSSQPKCSGSRSLRRDSLTWKNRVSFSTFQKERVSSTPLSSQGWIHRVSVLLCSLPYDLFICGVEHSYNPPHPAPYPQSPTSPIRNIEAGRMGGEARQRGNTV